MVNVKFEDERSTYMHWQEYWSGLRFFQESFPDQGLNPGLHTYDALLSRATRGPTLKDGHTEVWKMKPRIALNL